MALSRTVSDINSDCSRKVQIFLPRLLYAQLKGFPLELDIDARSQKLL